VDRASCCRGSPPVASLAFTLDELIAKYQEYQIDSFQVDEILNHKAS
jgi:hypothetical protein